MPKIAGIESLRITPKPGTRDNICDCQCDKCDTCNAWEGCNCGTSYIISGREVQRKIKI